MSTITAALCLALAGVALGCGTDPVNPDGCKSIESARCTAVAACPGYEGLDVDACDRFYRDQCLHGLAIESDPGDPKINACVSAIKTAGECAKTGNTQCPVATASPCTLIEHPEQFAECSFLAPADMADAGPEAAADQDAAAESSAEVPVGDGG